MPEPVDANVNPTPEVIEDDFTYDIVEETPQEDPKTLLLQTQIAEMQAKLDEAEAAKAIVPQQDNGMAELTAVLKAQNAPKTPSAQEAWTEKFKTAYEDANKNYHDDPLGKSTQLNALMMEKLQNDMEQKFNQQAATISQLNAQSVDTELMTKYGDEIKEIASALPPSASVYQEAIATVKMNHFDEIMTAQVEAAVAKQMEAILPPAKSPEEIAASVDFTNSVSAPATEQARRPKPQVTQAEVTKLEAWGSTHMLDWSVAGNKEFTIKRYLEHKANGGMI